MDPVSLLCLSAIGVVDVITKLGCGLRDLQREYRGALEDVDVISERVDTIEFVIREIHSQVCNRPESFSPDFASRFDSSTNSLKKVVKNLDDHVQSVRSEAGRSSSKGKALHAFNTAKIGRWEAILGAQTQALMVLLQVSQMHSNAERTSVLEHASSRDLFEKASSMSAKLAKSADEALSEQRKETEEFEFHEILMSSRVYRRVCESSWRQRVSTGEVESTVDSEDCIVSSSASSKDAIPGRHLGSSSSGGLAGAVSGGCAKPIPKMLNTVQSMQSSKGVDSSLGQLEISRGSSSQGSTDSRRMDVTATTLATALSSFETSDPLSEPTLDETFGQDPIRSFKIHVEVEGVGKDFAELSIDQPCDYYGSTQEAITYKKECILTSNGIDPATYTGHCTQKTIFAKAPQTENDFPLSPPFLTGAIEQLLRGYYTSFVVVARFGPPKDEGASAVSILDSSTSAPESNHQLLKPMKRLGYRNYDLSSEAALLPIGPPIGDPTGRPHAYGGFSQVYKVKLPNCRYHIWHEGAHQTKRKNRPFALKKFSASNRDVFYNELSALLLFSKAKSPHITKLIGAYKGDRSYNLLFEWAGGNLADFWKQYPRSNHSPYLELSFKDTVWFMRQCLGLAKALQELHEGLNPCLQKSPAIENYTMGSCFGRHGDLKPSNILYFPSALDSGRESSMRSHTLQIADFGLARFHRTSIVDTDSRPQELHFTPMYRAPELSIQGGGPDQEPGPGYDIWSLGCVYLEFVTWFLLGYEGVENFRKSRLKHTMDGACFQMEGRNAGINPSTADQLRYIRSKLLLAESPIIEAVRPLLNILDGCFKINPNKRPSASAIVSSLSQLPSILDEVKEYRG